MKFMSILLKEGRKEDLKKKYSDKFNEETLDWILNISDLVDFNHKYTDFVLRTIDPETDVAWWAETIIDELKVFDKYQSQFEKKDINQYKSFDEFQSAVSSFKQKEKEKELESKTDKIYEDDNFLVLIPKTQEASCKYGSGTKWCVTQRNSGHFERYSSGRQGLYFILRKKGNQTDSHYKVAVHINEIGSETWWDSKDNPMSRDSVELFKEYFPDLYNAIKENHDEKRKGSIELISKIFDIYDSNFISYPDFQQQGKTLSIVVRGYENISDMPGKAMGLCSIYYDNEAIDKYDVYVSYDLLDNHTWSASVGFSETGDDFEPIVDLGLHEGWGFDKEYRLSDNTKDMWKNFTSSIINKVYGKIWDSKILLKHITKHSGPIWRPNRANYGYTFQSKDKGLIKKLIDYLDSGYDNGTKLDFLEYIGKLKSRAVNGKKEFAHSYSDKFFPQNQWRGHFSSFFASAKNAGIIQYVKEGRKFIMKKGPNFDAFKEGRLKAL